MAKQQHDIHMWATYTTRASGETVTVRAVGVDMQTYSVPIVLCRVVGGRFDGMSLGKVPSELTLSDESAAVLAAQPA